MEVRFITGGAVSADRWGGPYHGTEEEYMLLIVKDKEEFSWKYIDYGWEAIKEQELFY